MNGEVSKQQIFWVVAMALFMAPVVFQLMMGKGVNQMGDVNQVTQALTAQVSHDATVTVHVTGAVLQPGVYQVRVGTKVHELLSAIELNDGAIVDHLNIAKVVRDGQKIHIKAHIESKGVVNINTGTQKDLQGIRGIGSTTAKKIIDYRDQNGPFQSVDELVNISGISSGTVATIKGQITL